MINKRCTGICRNGKRCRNKAVSETCHLHRLMRRRRNPKKYSDWKVTFQRSPVKGKKLQATFVNKKTGKKRKTSFGATGYSDYTKHKDKERKESYLARHKKREKWNNPFTAGALSRWILWNKKSQKASISDFKRRFGFK